MEVSGADPFEVQPRNQLLGEGKKQEITLPATILQEPSFLHVLLRQRLPAANDPDRFEVVQRREQWDPKKTAIIVCDMWDLHHCKRAVDRVKEMAPRMNEVMAKARDQGVFMATPIIGRNNRKPAVD
jgi:hypothetical protein